MARVSLERVNFDPFEDGGEVVPYTPQQPDSFDQRWNAGGQPASFTERFAPYADDPGVRKAVEWGQTYGKYQGENPLMKVTRSLTGWGVPRHQTWPEQLARSGFNLAHDVWTGEEPTPLSAPRDDQGDVLPPVNPEDSTWAGRLLGVGPVGSHNPLDRLVERAQDMTALAGSGAFPAAEKNALGIFGGRMAKTADLEALKDAEWMAGRGHDPLMIKQATGWEQGADGKWRFEISDDKARLANYALDKINAGETIRAGTLGGYQHPELYQAYPELRNVLLHNKVIKGSVGTHYPSYVAPEVEDLLRQSQEIIQGRSPDQMSPQELEAVRRIGQRAAMLGANEPKSAIGLAKQFKPDMDSTMLHELQHSVQDIEGFARGGSPDDFKVSPSTHKYYSDVAMALHLQKGAKAAGMTLSKFIAKLKSDPNSASMISGDAEGMARYSDTQFLEDTGKNLERQIELGRNWGYEGYRRLAGEVEARNVQERRHWTPEMRRAILGSDTEEVKPRSQQIVQGLTEKGPSASVAPPRDIGGTPVADRIANPELKVGAKQELTTQGQNPSPLTAKPAVGISKMPEPDRRSFLRGLISTVTNASRLSNIAKKALNASVAEASDLPPKAWVLKTATEDLYDQIEHYASKGKPLSREEVEYEFKRTVDHIIEEPWEYGWQQEPEPPTTVWDTEVRPRHPMWTPEKVAAREVKANAEIAQRLAAGEDRIKVLQSVNDKKRNYDGDYYSDEDRELMQKFNDEAAKKRGYTLYSDTSQPGAAVGALAKSQEIAPRFYSAVEHTLNTSKMQKASPEQWVNFLRNQPGVKAEELSWLGLDDPKALGDKPLTRQQMLDHVQEHGVQIKEIEKKEGQPVDAERLAGMRREFEEAYPDEEPISDAELMEEYRALYDEEPSATEYSDYQLPGGDNYREKLFTLPRRDKGNNYVSSHWDEPNVLAHVRTNDRDVPGVGKVLHLEELQSDWHQAGRKGGYGTKKTELPEGYRPKYIDAIRDWVVEGPNGEVDYSRADTSEGATQRALNWLNTSVVPDAPFKTTWPDLVLKRMVHEAVEKGYDAVSWTPGQQQVERYGLSKHVSKLVYYPTSNRLIASKEGTGAGPLIDKVVPLDELPGVIGKEAADRLLNNPSVKRDLPSGGVSHELSGLDLKIGGEGMKAFYDKMLVDKANALGKKFGAKVEWKPLNGEEAKIIKTVDGDYEFEFGEELFGPYETKELAEKRAEMQMEPKVPVLRITPQLKDAALSKGFPLYSGGFPLAPAGHDPFDQDSATAHGLQQRLNQLKEPASTRGDPLPTHPAVPGAQEAPGVKTAVATALIKTGEWGAFLAARNKPKLLGPLYSAWVAQWPLIGRAIKDEVTRQVKAGVKPQDVKFEKGSAADGFGLISMLQEKFGGEKADENTARELQDRLK